MKRTILDFYILQTVPPSNINRDESGSPKSATFGGTRRARASSQSWKRATRTHFQPQFDTDGASEFGVRTTRSVELLAAEITKQAPKLAERAEELSTLTLTELLKPKKKLDSYLLFLSHRQIESLAVAAITAAQMDDPAAALKKAKLHDLADQAHSVDIALFGRMVADQASLNVDAAAQVAHAISVHPVETEYDYYTAGDDFIQEQGEETPTRMMGTVEFNSSTLYRYAALNVNRLRDNLGDNLVTQRAAEAFTRSFVRSMPTGKQTTFAHRTLPEAIVVVVRDTQSINLAPAFETAVRELERAGRVKVACEAMRDYALEIQRAYGETPIASWVTRLGTDTAALDDLGDNVTFADLVSAVGQTVRSRLASEAKS